MEEHIRRKATGTIHDGNKKGPRRNTHTHLHRQNRHETTKTDYKSLLDEPFQLCVLLSSVEGGRNTNMISYLKHQEVVRDTRLPLFISPPPISFLSTPCEQWEIGEGFMVPFSNWMIACCCRIYPPLPLLLPLAL
mmetsp:Transcript_25829/g.50591  ORF Transcript_25829/g.50591 Transcript_25829/m.50591 type:complete len:135 (-) Transcript_25829:1538-1942(-)